MKRHVQYPGVRKWSGDDLLELQGEGLSIADSFFSQYGNCVICGCSVFDGNISAGLVTIGGIVMSFEAVTGVEVFPVYLVKDEKHIQREYADDVVRDIAIEYYAKMVQQKPNGGQFVEISKDSTTTFFDGISPKWRLDIMARLKELANTDKLIQKAIPTKLSQLENDNNTVRDASYVHTDNNYTSAEKARLARFNFVPTLDHEPGDNDLTFTDKEGLHSFLVGDMARVLDTKTEEYVFWQLYDITSNRKALWKKVGSVKDIRQTEEVNITLSSNQAQPDLALNGVIIHLIHGSNDVSLVWQNGTILAAEIPMGITYRIVYPIIPGYTTPEEASYVALAGNTRIVNAAYNTTMLTIDINSNQIDRSGLNKLTINISGSVTKTLTYTGQPLSLKIPTGKQVMITPSQVDGYVTVPALTKTPSASVDFVTFTYNATRVNISLTSNQGTDTALNGTNIAVKYGNVTKNMTWQGSVLSLNIPTGISFSVSSGSISGYNAPASKTQIAVGVADNISLAYTTEKVTINVTTEDDANVAGQTLTVTNTANGTAIHSGKAGTGIVLKIPFQTKYKVAVNNLALYTTPQEQSFTANSPTRIVSIQYKRIPDAAIVFDKSISDPKNITGEINSGIIAIILSKFRRCLCKKTANGEAMICYLKDTDSDYYADNTTTVLTGSEGDVMVDFPDIYYKHQSLGNTKYAYRFAQYNVDGTYKHIKRSLLGAYKGYITGSKLYSRSGVAPTASTSYTDYFNAAAARGAGYQMIDFEQHNVIAFMLYAKYGTRDLQSVLGCGGANYSPATTTGTTNQKGNRDTVGETVGYVNGLGIEGVFGGFYEWVQGVTIQDRIWSITDPDGTKRTVNARTADGWITNVAAEAGPYFDMVPIGATGSETTYYSDYYYQTTGSGTGCLLRSHYGAYTHSGPASGNTVNPASSTVTAHAGRLAFRGVIRVAASVAAFKALSVL